MILLWTKYRISLPLLSVEEPHHGSDLSLESKHAVPGHTAEQEICLERALYFNTAAASVQIVSSDPARTGNLRCCVLPW